MICRECGARIDDDAAECKFCGAVYGDSRNSQSESDDNIVEDTAEITSAEEKDEIEALFDENEEKRRVQMEKLREEKQSQLEEIEKRRKDRKRSKRRNIMLIAVLVLLLAGAAAAGIFYISPAYNEDSKDGIVIVTQSPTQIPTVTDKPKVTPEPEITTEPDATPIPETVTASSVQADVPQKTANPASAVKPVQTVKPSAKQKKTTLSSAVITGAEVISTNGKNYMSFIYNGKWYYAKVSSNTTTSSIAWKQMIMSGYSNGEKYKGVDVFTVTDLKFKETVQTSSTVSGYILPNSSSVVLTDSDLNGKTAWQLRIARNEIYARHGRKFSDSSLQNYFDSCSWYHINSEYTYSNDNANLNDVEKANVKFIKQYEEKLK